MNLPSRQVLVCQNRTCRSQGGKQVKAAFQHYSLEGIEIISSGCLGECGNGVMVLILPEKTWYWHIQPYHVEQIVNQHLKENTPVKELLDPKFHPQGKAD
ncbi:MAG: ferredoxin [Microcystaceae cyanobacterium]